LASLNGRHFRFGNLAAGADALGLERGHARPGEVLGHARARLAGAFTE